MGFYILSSRHLLASPIYAYASGFEDILVNACNAKLILPSARSVTRSLHESSLPKSAKKFLKRAITKTKELYILPEEVDHLPSDETNTLLVVGMNGASLEILDSIHGWRRKFDQVVALIYDAWLFSSYPQFTRELDHLFVPVLDLVPILQSKFSIPVSFLPYGVNVLEFGSYKLNRCIDVTSYGRIPTEYHTQLFDVLNAPGSDTYYYSHAPAYNKLYPEEPYSSKRPDYQHRILLNKALINSKISLAFDFTYTTKRAVKLANDKKHPSQVYQKSMLALRWFEGLAAGCAIVGKRPIAPEVDKLLYWEDSTIELPDEIDDGVAAILDLLKDQDRLEAIHQRNFWESLRHHDYRWRIKAMCETLNIPVTSALQEQLDQMEHCYASRDISLSKRAEPISIPG